MNLQDSVAAKVHPQRFPNMSGQMAAILGAMLGQSWTAPAFDDLVITSDGALLGQEAGDIGLNHFLGAASDLEANLRRLIMATPDLTDMESAYLLKCLANIRRA